MCRLALSVNFGIPPKRLAMPSPVFQTKGKENKRRKNAHRTQSLPFFSLLLISSSASSSREMDPLLVERPQKFKKITLVTHPRPLIRKLRLFLKHTSNLLLDKLRDPPATLAPAAFGLLGRSSGSLGEEIRDLVVVKVGVGEAFEFFVVLLHFHVHGLSCGGRSGGVVVGEGNVVLGAVETVVCFQEVDDGGCAEEACTEGFVLTDKGDPQQAIPFSIGCEATVSK